MKTIAIVIASQGYQQIEYNIPKKILQEHGHKVVTFSDKSGQAIAKDGTHAHVDHLLKTFKPSEYDALIFVGGPGAIECLDHDESYRIIQQAVQENLVVGAICISTRILAKSGVLAGKQATGWDNDDELTEIFRHHGVIYVKEPVVTDGRFVTATGPEVAVDFAKAIIEIM